MRELKGLVLQALLVFLDIFGQNLAFSRDLQALI